MRIGTLGVGVLAACALLLTGSRGAEASTEHYPLVAPGPLLLNTIGPSGTAGCIDKNIMGGLQLGQPVGMSICPFSVGGASGWSPWRGADINIPYAANPGSSVSALWVSTVPANSELRARVAMLDNNGAVVSVGSFVSGGGTKSGWVDVIGGGIVILNVQMRGFRSGTSGSVPAPILHSVAGQHYAN